MWNSPGQRILTFSDLKMWLQQQQVTVKSDATSGTGGSLLFFILQEVGWLVPCHPSPIHHLEGRVSTGVVHAAQWSVPAGRRTSVRSTKKRTFTEHVQKRERLKGVCVLTLYRKVYSRAHIVSSRTTRCHDMSNPVECWKTAYFMGLWPSHPLPCNDLPFLNGFLKFKWRKWHCIHVRLRRWKESNDMSAIQHKRLGDD